MVILPVLLLVPAWPSVTRSFFKSSMVKVFSPAGPLTVRIISEAAASGVVVGGVIAVGASVAVGTSVSWATSWGGSVEIGEGAVDVQAANNNVSRMIGTRVITLFLMIDLLDGAAG